MAFIEYVPSNLNDANYLGLLELYEEWILKVDGLA